MIPIWVDAGYRFNENIFAGAYFQYGFGLTKNCLPGASCSGNFMRFGAEGIYTVTVHGVGSCSAHSRSAGA